MTYFSDSIYSAYGNRPDLKPNCSQCGDNDCVELIDSMLTSDFQYPNEKWDTLPIWHCSRCKKVFGDRSVQMTTIYNSHGTSDLTTTTGSAASEKENRFSQLENKIFNIETDIYELKTEIQKQKEDILHAIKDRVDNFKLI